MQIGDVQLNIQAVLQAFDKIYDPVKNQMKNNNLWNLLQPCKNLYAILKTFSEHELNIIDEKQHSLVNRRIIFPLSYLYTKDIYSATQFFNKDPLNKGNILYNILFDFIKLLNEKHYCEISPAFINNRPEYKRFYFIMYPVLPKKVRQSCKLLFPKDRIKISNNNNLLFLL